MEIKYLNPEKNIFEECLHIGVVAGQLTLISGTNVRFPYLWRLNTNLFEHCEQHMDARA